MQAPSSREIKRGNIGLWENINNPNFKGVEFDALKAQAGLNIHQKQEEQGWGKAGVETLANDLHAEFPGRNNFSARNLWNMRDFYRNYSELPKLQPLVAETRGKLQVTSPPP